MKLPLHNLRCRILEKLYQISVNFFQVTFKRHAAKWSISKHELGKLPIDTLGYHLFIFLESNNFELQDKLESHDVFHVITNTGVSVPEEISLQFLLLGNGKKSIYGVLTTLIGVIIIPEHLNDYCKSYKKGNTINEFHHFNFETMLILPMETINDSIYRHSETCLDELKLKTEL
jgi:ubiquinone biosynthesis protein Coq4